MLIRMVHAGVLAGLVLLASPILGENTIDFSARMTGAQSTPEPVPTQGAARATARFEEGFSNVRVAVRFRDLDGTPVALHFHCNVAGANGPIALGLISPGRLTVEGDRVRGTLTNADFPETDPCPDVIGRPVNNLAALAAAMERGYIYANLHTDVFPAGEVRGQMRPAAPVAAAD